MGVLLSKAEREFLERIKEGTVKERYSDNYRRVLKFKILRKRKELTGDLVLINEVLDQLQDL